MSDGKIPAIGGHDAKQDRGELNIKGKRGNKQNIIILSAVVLIILGFGVYSSVMKSKPVAEEETDAPPNEALLKGTSSINDNNIFNAAMARRQQTLKEEAMQREKARRQAEENAKIPPAKVAPVTTRPVNTTLPAPDITIGARHKASSPTPQARKLTGSVLVGGDGGGTPPVAQTFDTSLNSSAFQQGVATVRDKGSLDTLLMHGTTIPCVLETRIVSDYPGIVTCLITKDVYSANGQIVLFDRGSKVFGKQKVALSQGKARVFITWSDVETPEGVSARIDSLGTGPLGAAGVGAWVDNHFAERFGNALMLSFVDDALAAAATHLQASNQNNGLTLNNSSETTQNMATEALKNSINIPPTAYVNIGTRLNILVARDIDMSNVYAVKSMH